MHIEKVTEDKGAYRILISTDVTNPVDSVRLFETVIKYGRDASLGSEGTKIKLTRYTRVGNLSDKIQQLLEILDDIYKNQQVKDKTADLSHK